jgi:hypothetical protein
MHAKIWSFSFSGEKKNWNRLPKYVIQFYIKDICIICVILWVMSFWKNTNFFKKKFKKVFKHKSFLPFFDWFEKQRSVLLKTIFWFPNM